MRFSDLICKVPIPFDKKNGQEVIKKFSSQPPKVQELIFGISSCSPYLKGLLNMEYEWVNKVLKKPVLVIENEFLRLKKTAQTSIWSELRRSKRRIVFGQHFVIYPAYGPLVKLHPPLQNLLTWHASLRWKQH